MAELDDLLRALKTGKTRKRLEAIRELTLDGDVGSAGVSVLVDVILRDRSSVVRAEAVRALCRLCPHGETGLTALPGAFREGEPSELRRAAEALGQIAEVAGARVAASQLARALGDPDARIPWRAAEALGKVGAATPEVVPALTAAIDDAEVVVRRKATRSLGWIGPAAGSAGPRLAVALSDPVNAVRVEAALALVGIGPAARASVPALIGAAGGADDSLPFRHHPGAWIHRP